MVQRLALYGATSTALAAAVVGSAIKTRANFFAAAVTIGRSSASLMVLANFALFNMICFGIVVKKIFFGQLRSIEYEHLFERLWMFLTESLLALTIFREKNDFSIGFVALYSVLLFLKCFHWITADRVDYMDQIPAPGPPRSFHVRISSITLTLLALDVVLVTYTIQTIAYNGISSTILFASEFIILLAGILGTLARYIVGVIDLRRARGREDAPSWEEKSMYLFYIDLAVDFAKLLTYLCFFTVILLNYALPLHILRDVYMTLRSFISRCSDLVRYRRATRDMDAQYPNATAEQLQASGDPTCIICREEMVVPEAEAGQNRTDGPNETPKKLACGHIFHFHCLRSWLERQQSCPTCRRDVLRNPNPPPPHRATPAVPPQPAPGQAPPQPGQAAPMPPAPGGVAREPLPTPLQAMYNEFFRPNPQNQFGAAPTPTPVPPVAATTSAQPQTTEERIQTGIWGGPVTPGKFFPTPLGAGPSRYPPSTHGSSSTGTNAAQAGSTTRQGIDSSSSTVPRPRAPPDAGNYVEIASRGSVQSGLNTPFSSNPPQVFSSPGSHRQPAVEQNLPKDEVLTSDEREGDVDDDVEVGQPVSNEEQRRIAADAAMRRLGITVTPARPTSLPQLQTQMSSSKGKARAIEVEPDVQTEALADEPKHIPYLSSSLPPPHPQTPQHWWTTRTRDLGELRRELNDKLSSVDVTHGLEDRIRVLREVDEVIWGLMGELTQVRSRWEAEDRVRSEVRDDSIDHESVQ